MLFATLQARIHKTRILFHYKRESIKITENAIPNALNYIILRVVCTTSSVWNYSADVQPHILALDLERFYMWWYVYYCIQQTNHMDNLGRHINT